MAPRREGLRPPVEKPKKPPPLTNAEKCKAYRERMKADKVRNDSFKEKKKEQNKSYRQSLTPEQQIQARENARLRQQKRRNLLKQKENEVTKKPKARKPRPTTPCLTRQQQQKLSEKKERNRLSQQKRRANMSSQKRRRVLEKRRADYHEKKKSRPKPKSQRQRLRVARTLFQVKETLKHSKKKIDLWKLDFLKRVLDRKVAFVQKADKTYYNNRTGSSKLASLTQRFYSENAVDYPGKKGSSTAQKILTKPLYALFKDFRKKYPDVKISLTSFKRSRPDNILLSSSRKFEQCLCEQCTNFKLLLHYIRKLSGKGPCYVGEFVDITLCPDFSQNCIERKCEYCGVHEFVKNIREKIGQQNLMVKWKRWEKTEMSRKDLVKTESTLDEFLKQFEISANSIAKHYKTARWQRNQYRNLKVSLPPKHAMCTVDFAENYLCKYQDEVQSAHWSYRQVTVHPCVFFYKCNETGCDHMITEYVVYLSDDLKHSSEFTRHVLQDCVKRMESKGMNALHVFSDGCSSQYKSRYTFRDLAEIQKQTTMTLTRHYFGSSHGKSLCDSCGGVVKNAATNAVRSRGQIIQSANDMFNFCSVNLSVVEAECCDHTKSLRSFVLVDKDEVRPRKEQCPSIQGIMNMHSLRFSLPDTVKSRRLSCFCSPCLTGVGSCKETQFTGSWQMVADYSDCVPEVDSVVAVVTINGVDCDVFPYNFNDDVAPVVEVDGVDCEVVVHKDSVHQTEAANNVQSQSLECDNVTANSSNHQVLGESGSANDQSRAEYFVSMQEDFLKCSTFRQLKSCVDIHKTTMRKFSLPKITAKCVIDVGIADKVAMNLVPEFAKPLCPVFTVGDGNCLPRSLSLHCFGDQEHHVEIRCRIVVELVSNSLDYLTGDANDLRLLHLLSDAYSDNITETFQLETLQICKNSVCMGIWQLMAAANVLECEVFSLYPNRGIKKYIDFFTRKLKPRVKSSESAIVLLWSVTHEHEEMMPEDHWTANHVVSLMGLVNIVDIDLEF